VGVAGLAARHVVDGGGEAKIKAQFEAFAGCDEHRSRFDEGLGRLLVPLDCDVIGEEHPIGHAVGLVADFQSAIGRPDVSAEEVDGAEWRVRVRWASANEQHVTQWMAPN